MKKVYLVNIIAIVLVFVAVVSFMTFMPRTYGFINNENRNVTEFPSFTASDYFSGKYTEQISEWFTDSIPYKSTFKDWVAAFKELYGISTEISFINTQEGADDSRPTEDVSDPLADLMP